MRGRIWVDSVSVRRMHRRENCDATDGHIGAIGRVEIPRRRVDESDIGDDDAVRVEELEQVAAGVLELLGMVFVPPDLSLAVDSTIFTGNDDIGKVGSSNEVAVSWTWFVPSSSIRWQGRY
uniref:Uncharacterized protein n=1 Tax=Arundo donax TaxID=35708 RepID=A0A0A9EWF8_ARUDO